MHGLVPYKDIDIKFTGMRPGEKLFEELLTAEEGTIATKSDKIFVARSSEQFSIDDINGILVEFRNLLDDPKITNGQEVRALLRKYIRHYHQDGAPTV